MKALTCIIYLSVTILYCSKAFLLRAPIYRSCDSKIDKAQNLNSLEKYRNGVVSIGMSYSYNSNMSPRNPTQNNMSPQEITSSNNMNSKKIIPPGNLTPQFQGIRTFSAYTIYKGKAALQIKPIPPTFTVKGTARSVSRYGGILLQFAPIAGVRKYDWSKRSTFLLDVSECGGILALDILTTRGLEMLHDPNMGSNQAGQITKKLRITPTQNHDGLFISLQINNKNASPISISIPISLGEIAVIKNIIEFSIPRFLAFDCVWAGDANNEMNEGEYSTLSSSSVESESEPDTFYSDGM